MSLGAIVCYGYCRSRIACREIVKKSGGGGGGGSGSSGACDAGLQCRRTTASSVARSPLCPSLCLSCRSLPERVLALHSAFVAMPACLPLSSPPPPLPRPLIEQSLRFFASACPLPLSAAIMRVCEWGASETEEGEEKESSLPSLLYARTGYRTVRPRPSHSLSLLFRLFWLLLLPPPVIQMRNG